MPIDPDIEWTSTSTGPSIPSMSRSRPRTMYSVVISVGSCTLGLEPVPGKSARTTRYPAAAKSYAQPGRWSKVSR